MPWTKEFDIIAHNMANVSTAGFKRRCNSFTRRSRPRTAAQGQAPGDGAAGRLRFLAGHAGADGPDAGFALHGKGFFVIESAGGPAVHAAWGLPDESERADRGHDGPAGRRHVGAADRASQTWTSPICTSTTTDASSPGRRRSASSGSWSSPDKEDQLLQAAGENCFCAPKDVGRRTPRTWSSGRATRRPPT